MARAVRGGSYHLSSNYLCASYREFEYNLTSTYFTVGIRVVTIPAPLGDLDGDNEVSERDIDPFVDAVLGGLSIAAADMNQDGAVNGLDVKPFVELFIGALLSGTNDPSAVASADRNDDGAVNGLDVAPFAAAFSGAQAVPEPSTVILATIGLLALPYWRRKGC